MRAQFILILALVSLPHAAASQEEIPPVLEDWRSWVLDGKEYLQCPFFAQGSYGTADQHPCAWPTELDLDVENDGADFRIQWRAYAPTWIPLPGSSDHWPLGVEIDAQTAPVVVHQNHPSVFLEPGRYEISGHFSWQRRPEELLVPPSIARVSLSIDGETVFPLQRSETLWLGRATTEASQTDSLAIEVFRHLSDGLPAFLETRIDLDVSGQGREMVLGPVLPTGFFPVSTTSRLHVVSDEEHRLTVQLRPGQWQIVIVARAIEPLSRVVRGTPLPPWPSHEIWSYADRPRFRITTASGGLAVDPSQVDVPPEWNELPSFSLGETDALEIDERSRGMAEDANRFHLVRQLWIDFDNRGATIRDRIDGQMVRGFRLDMTSPMELSRAQADGNPLLVTTDTDVSAGTERVTGIELRNPTVAVEATARIERTVTALPVTGWSESFESVTTTIHLPPGRELVAAIGADSSPQSWISRWNLLDVFLVLITALLTSQLLGHKWAGAMAAFLTLSYHESPGPLWLLILVVGTALGHRAVETTRFGRALRTAMYLSLGLLALVVVPFGADQLRLALYPQLERHEIGRWSDSGSSFPGFFPAAEPRTQMNVDFEQEDSRLEDRQPSVRTSKSSQRLQRYAASNVFQSGGAEPAWGWRQARLSWSGPVLPDQQVRLVMTPRWLTRGLRLLMVALLAALVLEIFATVRGRRSSGKSPSDEGGPASVGAGLALLFALFLGTTPTSAEQAPDSEILSELGQRLSRAPECVPTCGHLEAADVTATEDLLEVNLTVHAAAPIAIPIPSSQSAWDLERLVVNGRQQAATLASRGKIWIALERGVHRVRLSGPLAEVNSAELEFPLPPARISATAVGWDVSGLHESSLVTDTLSLVRVRETNERTTSEAVVQKIASFVRVERSLDLDLDWTITTTVIRLAPTSGSLAVVVPVVEGENVLSPGFQVVDGAVTAALPAGLETLSWQSRLETVEQIEWTAPNLEHRAEIWKVVVSPQWSATFSGLPATRSEQNDEFWIHEFHPLPDERLRVSVARPQPVAGTTLAIDDAALTLAAGRRSIDHELTLSLRSTRGGQHSISLPAAAEVLEVSIDRVALNIRPDDGQLTFPLRPGEQTVSIDFRTPLERRWQVRSPMIDLGASASNLRVTLEQPADRWLLLTNGPRIGPAVLYWSELPFMVVVAFFLSRFRHLPLSFRQWVLLGLGFSTFSWGALAAVAIWLVALAARRHLNPELSWWRFDAMQLGLVILTFAAIGCLIAAIPFGLLGSPDMHVEGNGSTSRSLVWFDDLSTGSMPITSAVSLPLWLYRCVMLAWALWLASSVVGWLRWGWQCLTIGGGWRPLPWRRKPTPPAAPPADTEAE